VSFPPSPKSVEALRRSQARNAALLATCIKTRGELGARVLELEDRLAAVVAILTQGEEPTTALGLAYRVAEALRAAEVRQ